MSKTAGMTGPEHYLAGEEALAQSETRSWSTPDDRERAMLQASQAQAHFMAAQVAAVGAMVADSEVDGASEEWAALFGVQPMVITG